MVLIAVPDLPITVGGILLIAGGYLIKLSLASMMGWKKKVDIHLQECNDRKIDFKVLNTKVDDLKENQKRIESTIIRVDNKLDSLLTKN